MQKGGCVCVIAKTYITVSLSPRSAWCRKAFSLFAFITGNVGCNCHISTRKWELRAESASKMKLQNNFGVGGLWEKEEGRKEEENTGKLKKKNPQNYIILPMLSVFSSKIPDSFPIVLLLFFHIRERSEGWQPERKVANTGLWVNEREWSENVNVFCWIQDHVLAWGISDICVFLSSEWKLAFHKACMESILLYLI